MQLKEHYNKLRQEAARKENERAALAARHESLVADVAQVRPRSCREASLAALEVKL